MNTETKKIQPRTLSGFMELLPKDQIKFNQIVNTIQSVYERFGFLPIDTPLLELAQILLAKAGGETEKQIYRFKKGANDLVLRFDLTVPFAKYVAKNYHLLKFPFRKYQIGKVYRGERAQKGRYREFYQADIDIIGDETLAIINDAEIPNIIYNVFKELGLDNFVIKFNNRKLISGFLETLKLKDNVLPILKIIDKSKKVNNDELKIELKMVVKEDDQIEQIINFINIAGTNDQILEKLSAFKTNNTLYNEGLTELKEVVKYASFFALDFNYFKIDLAITRGLDYYTGTVYETFIIGHEDFGSICSGGRYDNLAGYYTNQKLPGVGISIGITRLFDLLTDCQLLPDKKSNSCRVLVIPLLEDNPNIHQYAIEVVNYLRKNKISTHMYSESKNLNSKINYAVQLEIPYIIFIGEDEFNKKVFTIKDVNTRKQQTLKLPELLLFIK